MDFMRVISVLILMHFYLTTLKSHLCHKLTCHITSQFDAMLIHHDGGNATSACECFESLNIWLIKALVLTASRLIGWALAHSSNYSSSRQTACTEGFY